MAVANFTFMSYLQATRDALVLRDILTELGEESGGFSGDHHRRQEGFSTESRS